MKRTWDRSELPAAFQLEKRKGKKHVELLVVGGRITLKSIIKKEGVKVHIGFTWLMLGSSGKLF
jgi:hypothetical protein